jgi:hypothetical protein
MIANVKSNQYLPARLEARIETNREPDWEERKAEKKADQEDLKRMMEEMNAKMDGSQAEMRFTVFAFQAEMKEAIKHEMKAVIQPIRAELDETTTCREATETEPDPGMLQS